MKTQRTWRIPTVLPRNLGRKDGKAILEAGGVKFVRRHPRGPYWDVIMPDGWKEVAAKEDEGVAKLFGLSFCLSTYLLDAKGGIRGRFYSRSNGDPALQLFTRYEFFNRHHHRESENEIISITWIDLFDRRARKVVHSSRRIFSIFRAELSEAESQRVLEKSFLEYGILLEEFNYSVSIQFPDHANPAAYWD